MKARTYFATIFDGMAKGLFASLIVGTIIKQIGTIIDVQVVIQMGQIAQYLMGPCIGAGIAFSRNAGQFTILSSIVAGAIGAGTVVFIDSAMKVQIGEPVGALAAALVGVEIGLRLEGRTKFDLLIIPGVVILAGGLVGIYISPVISVFMRTIGILINEFTMLQPVPMGILLGIVVGMILTLPISSAALCISINIGGLAAGAALAGCCAQMVGFAVMSFRENKFGGLISQGIGTSMLQVPNIIKNPWIWVPPTVAGGVCGLLSTTLFKMETNSVGAGMGTSGLVGQFTTFAEMGPSSLLPMAILHFLLPAVISVVICEIMRKKNIIKPDDLKL